MSEQNPPTACALIHVQPEPDGRFTAQVVGLPELRATAGTRLEAIKQVRLMLADWLAAGTLVSVDVPLTPLWLLVPRIDPDDPDEREFQEEMARMKREDLERTLREYEQEDSSCSDSSSTPTT